MDSSGKIVYAKNSEVLTVNVAGTQGKSSSQLYWMKAYIKRR